jgi:hypothetical protein
MINDTTDDSHGFGAKQLSKSNNGKPTNKNSMKKIKPKKRTLNEFKNWLAGLQEFQSDEWVPNRLQWDLIKSSIEVIKEPQPIESVLESVISEPIKPRIYQQPVQSGLDVPVINPSTKPHIDMRNPNAITQDIDTSDGNYISDFK